MSADLCIGYERLSIEDGDIIENQDKRESDSISNQRELIADYLKHNDILKNQTFVELIDDGYSGANFRRPQMQKLLEWVKQDRVRTIIVKDISRFGRDYITVGDYLEQVFPFMGVRFISINDNYDSDDYVGITGGIDIAFRSILYNMYSKDLSVKTNCARKMRINKGYFTGGMPPFGYEFASEDKRLLQIDPVASIYVKRIFELAIEGMRTGEIARILNNEKIPTPAVYKNSKRKIYSLDEREQYWNPSKVRKILQNETYLGTVVNNINRVTEVGSKRFVRVPDEQRSYSPGKHEAIVSEQDFKEAHKVFRGSGNQKYKKHCKNINNILGGYLYCPCCKKALTYVKGKRADSGFYRCQKPVYHADAACPQYKYYKQKAENTILTCINTQLEIMQPKQRIHNSDLKDLEQRNKHIEIDQRKLKSQKQTLYEDYRGGILSGEQYKSQSAFLLYEKEKNEKELLEIDNEIQAFTYERKTGQEMKPISALSKEVLSALIEKIWVYDEERIEIIWKATGY